MKKGFTLIELLTVIAIIGLLASVIMVGVNSARAKAADKRRIIELKQIETAIQMYYDATGHFPENTDNDFFGYDVGYNTQTTSVFLPDGNCQPQPDGWCYEQQNPDGDTFLQPLADSGFFKKVPGDFNNPDPRYCGYNYYLFSEGSYGCDPNKGRFFVIGTRCMSDRTRENAQPEPDSPGFACPLRNWHTQFLWVTGEFEN